VEVGVRVGSLMANRDKRAPLAIFGGFNLGGAGLVARKRYQCSLIRQVAVVSALE